MQSIIFAVYDIKVKAYLQPFFLRTTDEAIRSFESAVNDPQTNLNKYPGDFYLFQLASFDDETASIVPYNPVQIAWARDLIKDKTKLTNSNATLENMAHDLRTQFVNEQPNPLNPFEGN